MESVESGKCLSSLLFAYLLVVVLFVSCVRVVVVAKERRQKAADLKSFWIFYLLLHVLKASF